MNLLQIHEPGQTPLPHEDSVAVGIDLGTTHSLVAIGSEDKAEVIRNIHGHGLVPSVVYYGEDGKPEVGYSARQRYERGEKGVIASVKRLMGRGVADIKPLLGNLPYDVVLGEGMVKLKAGLREVTPVEVSAEILRTLKHQAEKALGRNVKQAVITVPAYFDDAARSATKDAAKLAGLEVLRLVNEPTAAALAYGLDKGAQGIYAIFDLGGGTFDISLLKLEQGVFQVLATAGDTQLGGDDFDQAIAAWLLTELGCGDKALQSHEIGELVSLARQAKHTLSNEPTATISYAGKTVALDKVDYENLITPYIDKAIRVCEQALMDAKLSTADIKGIVMVGGSTRVPLVRERVAGFFAKEPLSDVDPDEVVAIGAAIQAHGLTQGSNNLLLDVIPLSLGLETMGELTEKILQRNTPIPVTAEQEFTTYQDNQTGMKIHVLQGEREMVGDNRSLARFELVGIPPLPAGVARVKVIFSVDADGLLTVTAEEMRTGVKQKVQVKPSYGLETDQIEAMLRTSMEHAREDIMERMLAEAKLEAERAAIEIESAIAQDAELLESAEKRQIEEQIRIVRNAAAGEDRDYIDVEVQQLGQVAQAFAQRRMDKAIGLALKGAHIDSVETKKHA